MQSPSSQGGSWGCRRWLVKHRSWSACTRRWGQRTHSCTWGWDTGVASWMARSRPGADPALYTTRSARQVKLPKHFPVHIRCPVVLTSSRLIVSNPLFCSVFWLLVAGLEEKRSDIKQEWGKWHWWTTQWWYSCFFFIWIELDTDDRQVVLILFVSSG